MSASMVVHTYNPSSLRPAWATEKDLVLKKTKTQTKTQNETTNTYIHMYVCVCVCVCVHVFVYEDCHFSQIILEM
jgi:hypothetical protein